MNFKIDTTLLNRTTKLNNLRYEAIAETLQKSGMGEVLTSKRKKMKHERARRASKKRGVRAKAGKKVVHGRLIAWFLKKQGNDPFEYVPAVSNSAVSEMNERTAEAIDKAADTSKGQQRRMKQMFLEVTALLVDGAIERIESGKLGSNTLYTREKKRRLVEAGIATIEFGDPPPFGVLTGRFLDGIRNRWRQGRLNKVG